MAQIKVANMYTKVTHGLAVDTTSRSGRWAGLSPFNLADIPLYKGANPQFGDIGANFENVWQYAKVYGLPGFGHVDANNDPTPAYWTWARLGWVDSTPRRYPMGRGARPLYSLWDGQKLGYIDARKAIYGPLYAKAVQQTDSYQELLALIQSGQDVTLRDYDGYDHDGLGMTLTDVLNNPRKKMGHSFVLKALLTNDPVLGEFK